MKFENIPIFLPCDVFLPLDRLQSQGLVEESHIYCVIKHKHAVSFSRGQSELPSPVIRDDEVTITARRRRKKVACILPCVCVCVCVRECVVLNLLKLIHFA